MEPATSNPSMKCDATVELVTPGYFRVEVWEHGLPDTAEIYYLDATSEKNAAFAGIERGLAS